MYFGLDLLYTTAPSNQAFPNIVCVHGYGQRAETTWHHEGTGKTWIADAEFLQQLDGAHRVFSFTFNGDVSANLSAAGIAFHAHDLLSCIDKAIDSENVGPVFLVAHSWGGIIVKKAIQLCWAVSGFPNFKAAVAGVFFLGTPHITNNTAPLLQAVRHTVKAYGRQDEEIPDAEVREYVTAVCKVNDNFKRLKPDSVVVHSYWEKLPTEILLESGETIEELIVPESCVDAELALNHDTFVECSHEDLARFSSAVDQRFRDFIQDLNGMITHMVKERSQALPAPLTPPSSPKIKASTDPGPRSSSSSGRGSPVNTPEHANGSAPPPRDKAEEMFRYWERKSTTEELHAQRAGFLRSLKGWSPANTGSHLSVSPNTCEWIQNDTHIKDWLSDPQYGTMLAIGAPGTGKTHLARAYADHLRGKYPSDIVLNFHCTPNEGRPPIWEYFTWALINRDESWFPDVPATYRRRDRNSPPLNIGSFVEIWQEFRRACSTKTIYLIIDGLEQCGDERFDEFFSCITQLRSPLSVPVTAPGDERRVRTMIKVLFTCRDTCAVGNKIATVSWRFIPLDCVIDDVSRFVDYRLDRLTGLRDGLKEDQARRLKAEIKASSCGFWPYARFAVEQVERRLPPPPSLKFDAFEHMPDAFRQWCNDQLWSHTQSVSNERCVRTIITLMASRSGHVTFTLAEVKDMLQCLYDDDEIDKVNLVRSIRTDCSSILMILDNDVLSFVGDSMAYCAKTLLYADQRHANTAFVCLQYLLQDCFRQPSSPEGDEPFQPWLQAEHPFYEYAALNWGLHVRRSNDLAEGLLPLIKAFLSKDCDQYKTWCTWRKRRSHSPDNDNALEDPPVLALVRAGCTNALELLLPPPPGASTSARLVETAPLFMGYFRKNARHLDSLAARDWPETTDSAGQNALIIAAQSTKLDMVDYVLRWHPNLNARSRAGLTPLTACLSVALAEREKPNLRVITKILDQGANPDLCEFGSGMTALQYACAIPNLDAVRLLLDQGASVNISTAEGVSPLEMAFKKRNAQIFAELVEKGADVDTLWSDGEVPLRKCIIEDAFDMFSTLLPTADVNQLSNEGLAPIHACATHDRREYLRLLLKHADLDIDVVDEEPSSHLSDRSPKSTLLYAIQLQGYREVEMLLRAGAYAGLLPRMEVTPLQYATDKGDVEMMKLLLSYQSPVNTYTTRWPEGTALSIAVEANEEKAVALLLEYGADPTVEDAYDAAGPLEIALERPELNLAIVKQLLEAPIPPDLNNPRKAEAHVLLLAARKGNPELVRLLLEHGADASIWLQPNDEDSPLHVAAYEGFVEVCDVILQHEPRLLNAQSEQGRQNESPLHAACDGGHIKVVQFLLEKGASATQLSAHFFESPLLFACRRGKYEIAKAVLEAAPEMVNAFSYNGCSPLIYACEDEDVRITEMLLKAGADITHRDLFGMSCTSNEMFRSGNKRLYQTLELLVKYGLDFNTPDSASGMTVLGTAIIQGHPRDVEWLINHGADPLRCQRFPWDPVSWRNALQLAGISGRVEMLDLLLEPRWGLRKHLDVQDSCGLTVLGSITPSRTSKLVAGRIYHVCNEMQAETGEDMFTRLMNLSNLYGYTPTDYAAGSIGCAPHARPRVDAFLVSMVQQLLQEHYRRELHVCLVEEVGWELATHGAYDAVAALLLSHAISVPSFKWGTEGEPQRRTEAWSNCEVCGDNITGVCMACKVCRQLNCEDCVDKTDSEALHVHVWLEVVLEMSRTWDTKGMTGEDNGVREMLEKVCEELSAERKSSPSPEESEARDMPSKDQASEQSQLRISFQLAALHAFNLLAIRRPLFTPYLPLIPSIERTIKPWLRLIKRRRRTVERQNLEFETAQERLWQENRYVARGLNVGFVDEHDVHMGMVLEDVGNLFQEEEVVDE